MLVAGQGGVEAPAGEPRLRCRDLIALRPQLTCPMPPLPLIPWSVPSAWGLSRKTGVDVWALLMLLLGWSRGHCDRGGCCRALEAGGRQRTDAAQSEWQRGCRGQGGVGLGSWMLSCCDFKLSANADSSWRWVRSHEALPGLLMCWEVSPALIEQDARLHP